MIREHKVVKLFKCSICLLMIVFVAVICHADTSGRNAELNKIIQTQIYQLVNEHILYVDSRPEHQKDTKDVSSLFKACFEKRFLKQKASKGALRERAFKLLYHQSRSELEDGADGYWIQLNRGFVFASISLVSDIDRQYTFTKDALRCFEPNIKDYYISHIFFLMLDWIYAMEEGSPSAIYGAYKSLHDTISIEEDNPKALIECISSLYTYCKKRELFKNRMPPRFNKEKYIKK